jgi:excisionase family DNA binding protein
MSKSVKDVAELLGCSQEYVKAAYHDGSLPGYVLSMDGSHYRYLMTDEAFERLSSGDWRPKPKPVMVVREGCPNCVNGVQMAWDRNGAVIAAWECPDCKGGTQLKEEAA